MKSPIATRSALLALGLAGSLVANAEEAGSPSALATPALEEAASASAPEQAPEAEAKPAEPTATSPTTPEATEPAEDPAQADMKKEQERLALENSLADERAKRETARLRTEVSRLRAETELMTQQLARTAAERQVAEDAMGSELLKEKARIEREAELAKARAEGLAHELKAAQAEASIEVTRLQGEIQALQMEQKRREYADAKPQYLKQPLKDDGTVVISDRRIALNGPITTDTADEITERIHYFNNQDPEFPVFIVIDECPGGSVMAGYRILKAMEASDAPVHVVVKSFAASMAAAITTLAEESYAYPNAVILHHQISSTLFGRLNLTQQEEVVKESKRWWDRLATPIADKMGISKEEFIKRMYAHSSSGDWSEFGKEAQELKWVNHIVSGIDETSILRSPDAEDADGRKTETKRTGLAESLDSDGHPVMYLPRINPKDVYFLYNPDGYYQVR